MIYHWDGSALVECAEPSTPPDVVDSWVHRDGHRCATEARHRERFAANVPGAGEFLDAVFAHPWPTEQAWFPRIEAHGHDLYLRVRPAPPVRTTTVLWIPPDPDPRRVPGVKGPDLAVLGELRRQAQSFGADDALLWTPDRLGRLVAEAANSAVAWWEDDHLMFPQHPGQLPSVTAGATADMISGVGSRPITVEELMACPVWAGSALHGWTEVVGWVGPAGEWLPAVRADTPMTAEQVSALLRWG